MFANLFNSGWGKVSFGGRPSSSLRYVRLTLITNAECLSSDPYYAEFLTENMVCAGLRKGGKSSCHGDSGGPLVVSKGQGKEIMEK